MIYFFQGGLKKDPDGIANGASHRAGVPLSRANLRIWSKNRVFFGGNKFVNAYVERDKKILDFWIFALTPLRILLRSSGFATATPDRSAAGAKHFRSQALQAFVDLIAAMAHLHEQTAIVVDSILQMWVRMSGPAGEL